MIKSEEEHQQKNIRNKVTTYPVPFSIAQNNEDIIVSTSLPSTLSKDQIINKALNLHSKGNIEEAARKYQYFLDQGFADPAVLTNYGAICQQSGNTSKAIELYKRSIKIFPNRSEPYANLGNIYKHMGNLKEAEICYQKDLEIQPNSSLANYNLGALYIDLKYLKEAEFFIRKAIKIKPNDPLFYCDLGRVLIEKGDVKGAEKLIRKSIQIKPDFFQAYLNLGVIYIEIGNFKKAELFTRRAIEINNDCFEGHANLGSILKELGQLKDAEFSTKKAINLNPNDARSHSNLGIILKDLGKLKEAELSALKAIELDRDSIEAYINLGLILIKSSKFDALDRTYSICPENFKNDLSLYCTFKLKFSDIYDNQKQIDKEREQYENAILYLFQNHQDFYLENHRSFSFGIFFLAYHNKLNDKYLIEYLANSLSKVTGIIDNSFDKHKQIHNLSNRKEIRLGICSDLLRNHVIGNFFLNLIFQLASSGIEIIIFRGPDSIEDDISKKIDSFVSESIKLPKSHKDGCKVILNKSLDILFYPDLAMSTYTYLLSLSRLALVQCTSIGHPCTSGSTVIDYYISSKYLETDESWKHYTESLIKLSRLTCNHSEPKIISSTFKRSELHLPKDTFLIGLPHSLFKLHPDFDNLLEQILIEIPNSILFLIEGKDDIQTNKIKNRWIKNAKIILDRSIFYPPVNNCNFLEMIKSFDIVLDPIYFGIGNTFYQSMAFGKPVVTMPNDFQRTRNSFAGYKQMGIVNPPIASNKEEYISICKRLAFDKEYMSDLVKQINSKSKQYLFNDCSIYKEYLEFFEDSLNAVKAGEILKSNWTPNESKL